MLDIYIARTKEDTYYKNGLPVRLSLGSVLLTYISPYVFLDPYDDTEMSGYQLHCLKTELEKALIDLSARPSTFKVLVGWSGTKPSRESELWNEVNKDEAKATIEQFLELIDEAQRKGLSLWAIGD